jgi:hypothetical protein
LWAVGTDDLNIQFLHGASELRQRLPEPVEGTLTRKIP